jgi:putative transcriptional regulator
MSWRDIPLVEETMRVNTNKKDEQTMIRWRLRVLMAEKKITNKELSELSGVHATSISKLKNVDEIEQISGRVLNNLCNGLTRAYRKRGDNRIITPADLFDYTYDGDDYTEVSVQDETTNQEVQKDKRLKDFKGNNAQLVWLVAVEKAV